MSGIQNTEVPDISTNVEVKTTTINGTLATANNMAISIMTIYAKKCVSRRPQALNPYLGTSFEPSSTSLWVVTARIVLATSESTAKIQPSKRFNLDSSSTKTDTMKGAIRGVQCDIALVASSSIALSNTRNNSKLAA